MQDDHSKNIVGTPTYAAPEQLQGKCDKKVRKLSCKIDLVSNTEKKNFSTERHLQHRNRSIGIVTQFQDGYGASRDYQKY